MKECSICKFSDLHSNCEILWGEIPKFIENHNLI